MDPEQNQPNGEVLQNNVRSSGHHEIDTSNQDAIGSTTAAHRPAVAQTDDDAQYYRTFVDRLLNTFRNGDQETVDQMVGIIRSSNSHDEIIAAISHISEGK